MTSVSDYIFDGSVWRIETARSGGAGTTSLNLWRPPKPQNSIIGQGAAFDRYKAVPCFMWTGQWAPKPQQMIKDCVTRAAGRVIPLCVYGFPRLGYSGGGFDSIGAYRTWIDAISAGLGNATAIVVLEPDALGLHTNMSDGTTPEKAVSYAVARFRSFNLRAVVYIDASNWLDPLTQAKRLRGANIAMATGFATNVSNFKGTTNQVAYCESVNAALVQLKIPAKKYVIDTGRNGNGELTQSFGPAADPWLSRGERWLNPPGRGLGLSPRAKPIATRPNFAAALWVKSPGSSDGNNPGSTWTSSYYPDRAPAAGQFWLSWMKDCLAHTNMSNLA